MVSWTRLAAAAAWALYLAALGTHPDGAAVATYGIRQAGLAAAGLLVLVAAVAARDGVDRRRPPWPGGWGFCIAIVPLVLLLRTPPAPLDHRAALGRQAAPQLPPAAAAPAIADGDEVRIDRLGGAIGRRVRATAMVVRPVGRLAYLLPPTRERLVDPVVLLRFRIICCAADAVPVAVQVAGIPPAEVVDGTWVQVEGLVQQLGDGQLLVADSWREVPAPAEPYLPGRSWFGP